MATLSANRVPIRVQHSPNTSNMNESYYSRTTSRVQSPTPLSTSLPSFDEPDGIKQRMKEFEERCKKWREEFFSKNSNNFNNVSAFPADFDTSFTPPPPPPPPITPSMRYSAGTPFADFGSIYQPIKTPTFSSTLHKSFVEDSRDGKKIYKVEFEIGDFKENELVITTQGNLLIIKGDREVKVGPTTETKTFNREITIPDYVNTNNLNAFLTGTMLTVEAPINNDVYYQRRTPLNSTSSSRVYNEPNTGTIRTSCIPETSTKTYESPKKTSQQTTSAMGTTSHYSSSKTSNNMASSVPQTVPQNSSYLISLQPPNASSYQNYYTKDDNSTTYKFDLKEFNQSDIHLSITENKMLEIRACKEVNDSTGKTYREFKRQIQLDDSVDLNSITNLLSSDGVLTLKIPYKQPTTNKLAETSLKTNGSISIKPDLNNNNLSISNNNNNNNNVADNKNCREYYSNDGKLIKLTYDLKEYEPEHLKIVLTTNKELRITAQINEPVNKNKGETKILKQCYRQYNLPSYIQPEQMKAIMSRDGLLTIDFSGSPVNQSQLSQQFDSHINLKS